MVGDCGLPTVDCRLKKLNYMINSDIKISIVIPVYNAQSTISKLVNQLISEISAHYNLEIVLVNDYSSDNSHRECLKLYNENKDKVKYITLARNFGEHNAVMAGLNKVSGDFTIIMDDDFIEKYNINKI